MRTVDSPVTFTVDSKDSLMEAMDRLVDLLIAETTADASYDDEYGVKQSDEDGVNDYPEWDTRPIETPEQSRGAC
jgi:hypothetical protein